MGKKTKTEHVLIFMKIVAWIAFFSFVVEIGAYLYVYILSFWNPEAAGNFYHDINLYDLSQSSVAKYSIVVFFMILTSALKAMVWWLVVKLIRKIKIANPFTKEVAGKLEKMSYTLFAIWVLGVTGGGFTAWLGELAGTLNDSWNHGTYLFMAGLVFIISQIFKRGIEIQSENELTV